MNRGITSVQNNLAGMVSGISNQVTRSMGVMTRLDLTQIQLTQSNERLAEAQGRYNRAVRDYGSHSEQAISAQRQLFIAQKDIERSNLQAKVSYVLIGAEITTMAMQMPKAIQGFTAMGKAAMASARAIGFAQVAATGGIAAIGILAGLFVAAKGFDSVGKTVGSLTQNLGEMRAELAEDEAAFARLEAEANKRGFQGRDDSVFGEQNVERRRKALETLRSQVQQLEEAQDAAALAFQASEEIRLAIVERNEPRVQAAIDASIERVEAYRMELAQPIDLTRREEVKRLYEQEAEALKQLTAVTDNWAADSAQAAVEVQRAWQASMQSLHADAGFVFGELGLQMDSFTQDFQEALLRGAGVSQEFIDSLKPAVTAEQLLATASGDARKALLEQITVTAKKDETTEEFRQRLIAAGLTEQEFAALVDETGRALKGQTEATREASRATGARSRAGSMPAATDFNLADLVDANLEQVVASIYGWKVGSFESKQNMPGITGSDIVGGLLGKDEAAVSQWGAMMGGGMNSTKVRDVVQNLILSTLPAQRWDEFLKQINSAGVPAFAHGFDGVVRGPSLFVAGEHGAERVQVSPLSRSGGGRDGGGGIYVAPGAIVVNGVRDPNAAANAIMDQLRRLGVG